MADVVARMQMLLDAASGQQQLDQHQRQQAQAELEAWEQSAFPQYITVITTLMSSEQVAEATRQLACLMVKNAVSGRSKSMQATLSQRWIDLDESTRVTVKHSVLNLLNSGNVMLGKTAASAIAKVARIELPLGWWPSLLPELGKAAIADNGTPVLQRCSLDAIGFICVEGAETMDDVSVIQSSSSDILNAVATCMGEGYPDDVRSSATQALTAALVFIEDHMENAEHRNAILTTVYHAARSQHLATRSSAFECLVNVAHHYYTKLEDYIQHLFKLTMDAIVSDNEKVAIQAIEFWSTLCDEETELNQELEDARANGVPVNPNQRASKGYILAAREALVPVLLQKLTEQEEDQDQTSWNVSMAAGACLTLIAQTIGDPIIDSTMQFMTENLESANWHYREASMLCFGSILEGPSEARLTPMIASALPLLLQRLKDEVELVRDTAAWCVGRICELHPESIIPQGNTQVLSEVMGQLYTVMTSANESARVVSKACWAVNNFAENLEQEELESGSMSGMFTQLAQALLQVTQRPDSNEANLRVVAYESLNSLIMHGAKDILPSVMMLVPDIMSRLHQTLEISTQNDAEAQQVSDMQSSLCGLLHVCSQRLEGAMLEHAKTLMELYLRVFNQNNRDTVHQEALMAVGALCSAIGTEFAPYMSAILPFLHIALNNVDQSEVFISAVGVVGDCCRALEAGFTPYAADIIRILVFDLRNDQAEQETRPPCLAAFGDIALAINGAVQEHLPTIVPLLVEAGAVSIAQTAEEQVDEEYLEHLLAIREAILDSYTGILQGLNADNLAHVFHPYVPQLIQFVAMVYQSQRTAALTKTALGVLGDVAHALGPQVGQLLNQPWIRAFLEEAVGCGIEDVVSIGRWTQSMIQGSTG